MAPPTAFKKRSIHTLADLKATGREKAGPSKHVPKQSRKATGVFTLKHLLDQGTARENSAGVEVEDDEYCPPADSETDEEDGNWIARETVDVAREKQSAAARDKELLMRNDARAIRCHKRALKKVGRTLGGVEAATQACVGKDENEVRHALPTSKLRRFRRVALTQENIVQYTDGEFHDEEAGVSFKRSTHPKNPNRDLFFKKILGLATTTQGNAPQDMKDCGGNGNKNSEVGAATHSGEKKRGISEQTNEEEKAQLSKKTRV